MILAALLGGGSPSAELRDVGILCFDGIKIRLGAHVERMPATLVFWILHNDRFEAIALVMGRQCGLTAPLVGIGGVLELGWSGTLMLSSCSQESGFGILGPGWREGPASDHTVRWGRLFPSRAPSPRPGCLGCTLQGKQAGILSE